jgi:putative ABC transport system permease protein
MSGLRTLARQMMMGEWRAHPLRALVAIGAIAIGVALGFAIHLINATALNEFTAAVKGLAGQADVQVSGREALFDESIYPVLARRTGVALASPALEVQASVPGLGRPLKIIGIDALQAGQISPALMGSDANAMLADDALFLSNSARQSFPLHEGRLTVRSGTSDFALRVAGTLAQAPAGQRIGVMDIGAAQWRFHLLGRLTRVDLKLENGVNREAFVHALAAELERSYPGRFQVGQPDDADQNSRSNNVSRAYRVNLTVLALVALFTGAFLVFSTQALSVMRRRSQFALLRVLGMERRQLLRQILLEGASLGIIGSLLGIAGGTALAHLVLRVFGGDLGAGYFYGTQPQLVFAPFAALAFFLLGLAAALAGCLAPALDAARALPAIAIKSGSDDAALSRLVKAWPSLACIAVAGALAFAPPVFELPLFGYASIALLLVGAIGLMPRVAGAVFGRLNRLAIAAGWQRPVAALALARLGNAPGQAGIALGGVLSSFSLMVAMAIMVTSFRVSVDDWLLQILPADLYARSAIGGSTATLGPREQAALASLPGVARVDFQRVRPISLAPDRPPVALIARDIDANEPSKAMAMVGPERTPPPGALPAWVSEAMLDLYQLQVGEVINLPLNGQPHAFFIAGAWRDYARQGGALQIRRSDYQHLTGDIDATELALWLRPGASASQVQEQIRHLPFGAALELAQPGDIRAMSMRIFDRSFAVTYLLEAIAIAIGLSGVAATFSAQTLARAREFGMLRHVGVTKWQILRILALEGGALTALGLASGFVLGLLISLVLVFVVNPQSFHWTMQLHLPWGLIASVGALLLVAAATTALLSGRYALSPGPLRAVREDW